MTPPPTPQVISAPHSPPAEGPSTSAGSREEANKAPVPKLSKKRCEYIYADYFLIPALIRQKRTISVMVITGLTPLSPKSDQDQFSPNNIHTLSRDKL